MARIDPRLLLVVPLLLLAGGCGDDEPSTPAPAASAPAPASPSVIVPSAAVSSPAPAPTATEAPDEDETTGVPDEPGGVSDQAQSYLDEALGLELGALEGASAEVADPRRKVLDRLPENPAQVLTALKNYVWYSPEARALYDKAVTAG